MDSGVSEADRFNEMVRTYGHLKNFVERDSTKLQNIGPSPLPI